MKILAFSDVHGHAGSMKKIESKLKRHNPDLIICAGDISMFSNNLSSLVKWLDELGKKTFVIHGNHEDHREMSKLCKKTKNLTFAHKKMMEFEGIDFVFYGGDGFSLYDKSFTEFTKKLKLRNNELILVTHGPPYNTVVDMINGEHCGNHSYTKFLLKAKPFIAISGHLHENFNKHQVFHESYIINPGMNGTILDTEKIREIIKKRSPIL